MSKTRNKLVAEIMELSEIPEDDRLEVLDDLLRLSTHALKTKLQFKKVKESKRKA